VFRRKQSPNGRGARIRLASISKSSSRRYSPTPPIRLQTEGGRRLDETAAIGWLRHPPPSGRRFPAFAQHRTGAERRWLRIASNWESARIPADWPLPFRRTLIGAGNFTSVRRRGYESQCPQTWQAWELAASVLFFKEKAGSFAKFAQNLENGKEAKRY
jgi:hypothetical protein